MKIDVCIKLNLSPFTSSHVPNGTQALHSAVEYVCAIETSISVEHTHHIVVAFVDCRSLKAFWRAFQCCRLGRYGFF